MKAGTTRRMVLGAYGNRCGEVNRSILESLVIFIMELFIKDYAYLLSMIEYFFYDIEL